MSKVESPPFSLTESDQALLGEITEDFPSDYAVGQEAEAAKWAEERIRSERDLTPGLQNFKGAVELGVTAIHVTGLRLPSLPPTPDSYLPPPEAEVYRFDVPHLALAGLAGTVYGNSHVRGGRILADVFPKPVYDKKPDSAFGSNEEFDFHADGAVQRDTTPNAFALHCLKNEEQAPTFFSTVYADDFDKDTYAVLQEPVYTIYYEANGTGNALRETPIIEEEPDGKLRLNYYGAAKAVCDLPADEKERYDQALMKFAEALRANIESVTLQPGEMLFVDNRHALHGRRAFSAQAVRPEDRRWLRRIFIAQDPELVSRINSSPGRVLVSDYTS